LQRPEPTMQRRFRTQFAGQGLFYPDEPCGGRDYLDALGGRRLNQPGHGQSVDENVEQPSATILDTEPTRCGGLRIEVYYEYPPLLFTQCCRQIDGRRCLAAPTLLIDDGNDAPHAPCSPLSGAFYPIRDSEETQF